MADTIPPFKSQDLMSIAKVLGDTHDGFTGSEIQFLLGDSHIPDVDPHNTKWRRLYNALAECQNEKRRGNHVIMLITRAMSPSQYTEKPHLFHERKNKINPILSLSGMEVRCRGLE